MKLLTKHYSCCFIMRKHSMRLPFVSNQLYRYILIRDYAKLVPVSISLIARYSDHLFAKSNQTLTSWVCRNTTVLNCLDGQRFRIYKGKLWRIVFLSEWHTGFKLGSFAKTKQLALFRQKAARKKKPVIKNTFVQLKKNTYIENIKQIKTGLRARNVNNLVADYERQLNIIH